MFEDFLNPTVGSSNLPFNKKDCQLLLQALIEIFQFSNGWIDSSQIRSMVILNPSITKLPARHLQLIELALLIARGNVESIRSMLPSIASSFFGIPPTLVSCIIAISCGSFREAFSSFCQVLPLLALPESISRFMGLVPILSSDQDIGSLIDQLHLEDLIPGGSPATREVLRRVIRFVVPALKVRDLHS